MQYKSYYRVTFKPKSLDNIFMEVYALVDTLDDDYADGSYVAYIEADKLKQLQDIARDAILHIAS